MKFSVLLITVFWLSLFPPEAALYAAAHSGIHVVVKGLRDDRGRVGCSLFNGPDGFPREKAKQFRGMWVPKHDRIAVCNFVAVPAATYAVTVLDDSNMDGKMGFDFIGLPTKGYGFSNDAKATLSPPSFKAASFGYNGESWQTVTIDIVYRTH